MDLYERPHQRRRDGGLRSRGRGVPRCWSTERNQHVYDILIFSTYLYAPTVLGSRVAPHKSILVPTAHDEPAIHPDIYKEPSACPPDSHNTEVERRFLTTHFSIRAVEEETVDAEWTSRPRIQPSGTRRRAMAAMGRPGGRRRY